MPEDTPEGSKSTQRMRRTYRRGRETVEDAARLNRFLTTGWLVGFDDLAPLEVALEHILEKEGVDLDTMLEERKISEKSRARFDGDVTRSVIRATDIEHDTLTGYALELLFRIRMTRSLMAAGSVQSALLEAVQIGLALREAQMKDWADAGWRLRTAGKDGAAKRNAGKADRDREIVARYRRDVLAQPENDLLKAVKRQICNDHKISLKRLEAILREANKAR